jgi:uncharacterized protein (TIGR02285 family)
MKISGGNMTISYALLLGSAMLSLTMLFTPRPLLAKDSVTWMRAVMPPYFIPEGGHKGQGYGDVITDILQEQLTEYDHDSVVTNITRHFYKFKQGEKVCSVGLYKTPEREEFMYFSVPSFLTLPPVIIIKKDKHPLFGNRTSVPLDEILQNKKMMIGLGKDRSYGNTTDTILKKYVGQQNVIEFTGQELSLNLFKMLMIDRLDGLIGLPEEALYQAEQMGIRGQLMTLTIEENQGNYEGWLSSVGCSKNAWGKKMIADVNRALLAQRPTERYRAAYERWLDPNSIETYRKAYREVFLNTTP